MTKSQLTLGADPDLPEGFQYQPDLISPEEEGVLLERIRQLPFKEFEFHGFVGKRRVPVPLSDGTGTKLNSAP